MMYMITAISSLGSLFGALLSSDSPVNASFIIIIIIISIIVFLVVV